MSRLLTGSVHTVYSVYMYTAESNATFNTHRHTHTHCMLYEDGVTCPHLNPGECFWTRFLSHVHWLIKNELDWRCRTIKAGMLKSNNHRYLTHLSYICFLLVANCLSPQSYSDLRQRLRQQKNSSTLQFHTHLPTWWVCFCWAPAPML